MHACGHDGHTTMVGSTSGVHAPWVGMPYVSARHSRDLRRGCITTLQQLVGAARLLTGQPRPPTLPVRLLFQPAEETNTGARQMVHAGALEGVAAVFGGHLDQKYDVGTIVVHHGSVNASTDTFTITVEGKGGHGARPHQGVDGILVGSEIVVALQTCLSREVNGGDAAVLTVGSFQAGDGAANVMAGRATLAGTFRALDVDVRMQMRRIVERVASSIAGMHGATVSVAWSHGVGPVVNTEREYDIARAAAMAVVGPTGTIALPSPNMGSEDFAAYMEAGWPGCYVRHGTATPGCSEVPAHSDTWDLNEDTLAVGAMYYARLANEAGERLAAAGATAVCGSLDEEKVL